MKHSLLANLILTSNKGIAYDLLFAIVLFCSGLIFINHYIIIIRKDDIMLYSEIKAYAINAVKKSANKTLSSDDMAFIKWKQHIVVSGKDEYPIQSVIEYGKVTYNVKLVSDKDGRLTVRHPVFTTEKITVDNKKITIPRFICNRNDVLYCHSEEGRDTMKADLDDMVKANRIIRDENRQILSDGKNDSRASDTRELSPASIVKKEASTISSQTHSEKDIITAIKGFLVMFNDDIDKVKEMFPNVDVDSLLKKIGYKKAA